jgi:ethanolamine utilization protein EutA (predicted chaperonin)
VKPVESGTEVGRWQQAIMASATVSITIALVIITVEHAAGWSAVEALGSHTGAFVVGYAGGVTAAVVALRGDES